MFLNLIIKKLNLKKYIVLNLIYITCASTLFGIFLDYPFEKYDRIYYIEKNLFYKSYSDLINLPSSPHMGHNYSSFMGKTTSIRPGLTINDTAILKLSIKYHFAFFLKGFPNEKYSNCKIYLINHSNHNEFIFLSSTNSKKCLEDYYYELNRSYKNFILNEIINLNSNFSIIDNNSIVNQINNFYQNSMNKILYFLDSLFVNKKFEEKKERRSIVLQYKNTITFFILPIWIYILFNLLSYNIQLSLKK